ncbi:hypothetical protein UA08_00964 [Talaromyces atroroseus]|uniref:Myb-like domain-containing protein n=1 Tax=Talaromyces atroroseus TaxID=1441469 RepID=A0A225B6M1_TALAT|nr:hypothetical protein UA08_00964 [Talaromyces atroroseus]OKL63779.1 hypothetical protein UA08_00964 [Talaromyces atroroseus]
MASEMSPGKARAGWTPELNRELFLAILESSSIDYVAIAKRVGEGHTKDTVQQRIYNLKYGRVKHFPMAGPGAAKSAKREVAKAKKRKLNHDSTTDGNFGIKEETD